jgi:hypothetical protein
MPPKIHNIFLVNAEVSVTKFAYGVCLGSFAKQNFREIFQNSARRGVASGSNTEYNLDMDSGIEFSQSAFKHGVTEENIRYAFAPYR